MLPQLFFPLFISLLCISGVTTSAVNESNEPQLVHLRVEGVDETIFEGSIWSTGHNITTASLETHPCYGPDPNNPFDTPTSALDDAGKKHNFTFDGDCGGGECFITTIAGLRQDTSTGKYWGMLINDRFTSPGGCQARVKTGDSVLWLYDAFSPWDSFLKLEVLRVNAELSNGYSNWRYKVKRGQSITFLVTNSQAESKVPVESAVLNGKERTDSIGEATVVFDVVGRQMIKAKKEGSIGSNNIIIDVV